MAGKQKLVEITVTSHQVNEKGDLLNQEDKVWDFEDTTDQEAKARLDDALEYILSFIDVVKVKP